MVKVCACMAEGFEEVEMLTVVDILRRADIMVSIVSVMDKLQVTGSHHICVEADYLWGEVDFDSYDCIFLPGGMPGTLNLGAHEGVKEQIKKFAESKKKGGSSMCGAFRIRRKRTAGGKKAVCYPGFEDKLKGAEVLQEKVVTDGNITTSRGMGTCIPLALELVSLYQGKETAKKIGEGIIYLD